jgi:hypothetical protein
VKPDRKAHKVKPDHKAHPVKPDHKVKLDHKDRRDQLDLPGPLGFLPHFFQPLAIILELA